eukprot:4292981-Karenia_brevis.AAC.1
MAPKGYKMSPKICLPNQGWIGGLVHWSVVGNVAWSLRVLHSTVLRRPAAIDHAVVHPYLGS